MSAEGMPPTEPSLLSRPLAAVTRLIVRYPLLVLVAGVAAAVWALVVSHDRLRFHTNRDDVLNPRSDYNLRWQQYTKEFGDEEDVVVVVEGSGRESLVPVLEDLAAAVQGEGRYFHAVMHKVDLSRLRGKGLHYLKPAELAQIDAFLAQLDPVLQGDWSQLNLVNMAGRMSNLATAPGAADPALALAGGGQPGEVLRAAQQAQAKWLASLTTALSEPGKYQSPWPNMSSSPAGMDDLGSDACRYLLLNNGRIGLVTLRFVQKATEVENFAQNTDAVEALRAIVARAKARFPAVQIGLTGLPVMENDEMRLSQSAMTTVTFLSLGGVFLVLVAGFGGLRHSVLATVALVLGTIWTVGYTTATVGYLNILSIAFGSILMGLGINYGIYYVARYLQMCVTSRSTAEALVKTAASVGPSITMGSFTAACSFFATALTDFRGIAQLGIIAGGGILLCWLAAMTVLPAMIMLFDAPTFGRKAPAPLDIYSGLRLLYRKPRLTLAATLVLTAVLAVGMGKLWYDDNLLNLQPVGLESVQLERKLLTETNQSAWFALSVAQDAAEALRRKTAFSRLPSVERVEELASVFPVDKDQDRLADEEQIRPLIDRIHRRLGALPERVPFIPIPAPQQLGQVLAGLGGAPAAAPPGAVGPPGTPAAAMAQLGELLRRLPPEELARRVSAFQQRLAADLLGRLVMLRGAANPDPPCLSDLPESLLCRFIGRSGKFLLKIYARHNIWDLAARETFVHEIRTVDKEVTGNPLQVYEASRDMKQSYQRAAIYALITIVVLLWFDFGSLHYTILAMAPLALGVLQMFGLMGLLGIPLNSANMIVLPLIIGLGAENGIHIINDFRRRSAGYRRMSAATTTAVLINSLTTMVGFAALMVASHQGLWSLGRVLTIGMSCCLMSALVLPNLLVLLPGGQRRAACDEEEHPAAIVPLRLRSQPGSPVPEPHFVAIVRRESVGTADHAGRC
ncbi:MAG: MMPL family transporter [Thermoguttaceae bacterium]